MIENKPADEIVDWDDFDYEEPALEHELDDYEVAASDRLKEFFDANPSEVFFGNQLAVQMKIRFSIGLPTGRLRASSNLV